MWLVWLVSVNHKIKREGTFFEKYDHRKISDFLHSIGINSYCCTQNKWVKHFHINPLWLEMCLLIYEVWLESSVPPWTATGASLSAWHCHFGLQRPLCSSGTFQSWFTQFWSQRCVYHSIFPGNFLSGTAMKSKDIP